MRFTMPETEETGKMTRMLSCVLYDHQLVTCHLSEMLLKPALRSLLGCSRMSTAINCLAKCSYALLCKRCCVKLDQFWR